MQMGIRNQQQAQFNVQQMSSSYANGISIWAEAMKTAEKLYFQRKSQRLIIFALLILQRKKQQKK